MACTAITRVIASRMLRVTNQVFCDLLFVNEKDDNEQARSLLNTSLKLIAVSLQKIFTNRAKLIDYVRLLAPWAEAIFMVATV